jgi:hypothetical protein
MKHVIEIDKVDANAISAIIIFDGVFFSARYLRICRRHSSFKNFAVAAKD